MSEGKENLELIRRSTEGDQEAIGQLLYDHYDLLNAYISARMPTWMKRLVDAEDILQETFGQAFRDVLNLDIKSQRAFVGWLKKLASNRIVDKCRVLEAKKRRADRRIVQPDSESVALLIAEVTGHLDTPGRIAARNERWRALQVAIASLPADQRDAVRLYCLEQQSLREVAAAMGRTEGAVRAMVHRAKKALREYMGRSSLWLSSKS